MRLPRYHAYTMSHIILNRENWAETYNSLIWLIPCRFPANTIYSNVQFKKIMTWFDPIICPRIGQNWPILRANCLIPMSPTVKRSDRVIINWFYLVTLFFCVVEVLCNFKSFLTLYYPLINVLYLPRFDEVV